jgi:hypothetical protein
MDVRLMELGGGLMRFDGRYCSSGVTKMRDLVLWFAGVPIVVIVGLHFMGFLR